MSSNFIKISFIFLTLLSCFSVYSQVGIGTNTPSNKATLEVGSSSDEGLSHKGFMPPRIPTLANRNSIDPGFLETGLIVFIIETRCLQIWDGNAWNDIICLPIQEVWINEIHYMNVGGDVNEGIEIAGPAGKDLSDYQLVLYNGESSDRGFYNIRTLSGFIDDEGEGFGATSFMYPNNSIQDGHPDGIALVQISTGAVIQFLSYGPVFVAADGPAMEMLSTNILVYELPNTPVGESLQLRGFGTAYTDFTWTSPRPATMGTINTGQFID